MTDRLIALRDWLQSESNAEISALTPLVNDASFRQYFRVTLNQIPYIVMDAPPQRENCKPFIEISRRLVASGLNAPKVLASELEQGFLWLTDLGSTLYLSELNETQVASLYQDALQALLIMQRDVSSEGLPHYDHTLLHQEMRLFTDWLLEHHLQLTLTTEEQRQLTECFEKLSESALSQPQVFVHRDYHSRNLMVCLGHNPGILDFQDAVKGAITYDLVSLLRDCYIAWPRPRVEQWAKDYFILANSAGLLSNVTISQFLRWFDWMGIQRHLKASGIFARLYRRDGKNGYLKDIPRTLNYIVEVGADYPEMVFLADFIKYRVKL
jgi:hypothetical protein